MKRYLIAGLLVWVPLGITIWVINFLVTTLDQTLLLVPPPLRPEALVGFHIPGLGVVLSFVILLATGVIAANFFGQRLIRLWESALGRIPVVKSIYSSVKQVSDTVLSDQGTAFRKALLVEFPRPGCWTIAFLTGAPADAVVDHLPGDHVSVYVPTTPNPTGGYFVMLPTSSRARARHVGRRRAQVHHLDGRGFAPPPPSGTGREARCAARRRPPPKLTRQGRSRRGATRCAAARSAACPIPLPEHCPQRPLENALKRTDYCGRIDRRYLGETVTLMGWVHRRRDHGGVIFVDLRDREGLVQIVFNPDRVASFAAAESLRSEYVIRVTGLVRLRPEGGANPNLVSGEIEVLAHDMEILNAAQTPPFPLDDENPSETVRLQHRVIDLRRAADAEEPDAAPSRGDGRAQLPRRATASSTSRRPCSTSRRRRARASSSCRRGSTTECSTRCRSRRSSSSRC